MNKLLWRYLIYFGIFITLVQLFEYNGTQELFAKCGFRVDFSPLGTYAPLFLSALLIDITYRIGKRQNEIAQRQNEIAEQQTALQKEQNKIAEFEIYREIYRDIYKLQQQARLVLPTIHGYFASNTAKDQEKRVADLEKVFEELTNKIAVDEADFVLRKGTNKLIGDAYSFACLAEFLLGIIPAFTKQNRPEISDYNTINSIRLQYSSDEDWINGIAQHIATEERLLSTIRRFVEQKQQLFEDNNNLLIKIQESYKNEL